MTEKTIGEALYEFLNGSMSRIMNHKQFMPNIRRQVRKQPGLEDQMLMNREEN